MHEQTFGSKAQVWHGTAKKTSGGLTKKDLLKNKHGRIVSRRKHSLGKKSIKHLRQMGYVAKKGHFKLFHKHSKRGGTGHPMGTGDLLGAPLDRALVAASGGSRRRRGGNTTPNLLIGGSRRRRGGMPYGGPLSPHAYDGRGVTTSGVDVQFVAGNAA